jgi:hypothetical protein
MKEGMISLNEQSLPINKNGIVYELMSINDIQEAVDCLAETFVENDPITRALGITLTDFKAFARFFCKNAVKEQLSVVARDRKRATLLGCLVSEDMLTRIPQNLEKDFPKFAPIISLMRKMDKDYIHNNHVDKNEVMHEFLLGVTPSWKGHNIGENLIVSSMIQGRTMNYRGAIAEIGNPITSHMHQETNGFYVVGDTKYKDFVYDHSKVFENIITDDNKSCKLVYKSF